MLNLVIFGPPGSGKGTQSEKLIERYGLVHMSTGDILRAEMAAHTELGKKAQAYMEKGELVPDADVIEMVARKIDQTKDPQGFIFDGFPRTTAQARSLRNMLTERDTRIDLVISLEVPEEELVKRLLKRGQEAGRQDDEIGVIRNRIEVYKQMTTPVIDFYKKMRKYVPVEGVGTIDEIFERIVNRIEHYISFTL
ncbi:MAG TPA: adenylate kinase [Bacteroidetes bacterium]|nr:adenylate kinase [Bacteroidota bacterium]